MTRDQMIDEYKQLQHLRELWSKAIMTWGQIFVPVGASILAFFLAQLPNFMRLGWGFPFLLIGWVLFFLCMIYWRWSVHHIDQQIVGMYPRMIELEKELEMEIQASYYYRNLSKKAEEYLSELISVNYASLKTWDYRCLKKFISAKEELKVGSPHSLLLQVWDEFVLEKSWLSKLGISSVNCSLTSRGHKVQDIMILSIIVIGILALIIFGRYARNW